MITIPSSRSTTRPGVSPATTPSPPPGASTLAGMAGPPSAAATSAGGQWQAKDMVWQLAPGEPEAGPWRTEPLSTVIEALTRPGPGRAVCGRPVVLAVDGRSNGSKTTLAARIGEAVPGSAVVHTDDLAWGALPLRLGLSAHRRDPGARAPGPGGQLPPAAIGRARPGRIYRGSCRLSAAGHRRGRRRAPGGGGPDRRPDLGAIRRARGRTAGSDPHWKAERGADPLAPSRMDGRGDTLQRRPANLGTRRCHRLRHPGDPLRPRHRNRRRTANAPGQLTASKKAGATRSAPTPGWDQNSPAEPAPRSSPSGTRTHPQAG